MTLDAYAVMERVYGVKTRSEVTRIPIPVQATGNVWQQILPRNSQRVTVTIQVLDTPNHVNLAILEPPNGSASQTPNLVIPANGSYYANLWEDFDSPCNPFWVLRKNTAFTVSILEAIITPTGEI